MNVTGWGALLLFLLLALFAYLVLKGLGLLLKRFIVDVVDEIQKRQQSGKDDEVK
ncbi:hypothetical protein ACKLNZ_00690 [Thermus scotoductus]|uniref:hypothetical protein n=1 Tax=Thermus scotoductus TaxID=37636 RepID=UPI0015620133|nr:hypothetical protein [Thermus scotoductus]